MKASDSLRAKGREVAHFTNFMEQHGVTFKFKEDIWWMRLYGKFYPRYLTHIVSALATTIYLPKDFTIGRSKVSVISTLAHESVHIKVYQKWGNWMGIAYMLPQTFLPVALAALAGPLHSWLYYFAAALLLLLPLPSPLRLHWELKGYAMTMAVELWARGKLAPDTYPHIFEAIRSRTYWLYISKKALNKKLEEMLRKIDTGEILKIPAFHEVQTALLEVGMVKAPTTTDETKRN